MRHLIVKILCIGLLSAGSVLTSSAQVTNAQKPSAAASATSKAMRHAPFRGKVASVDKAAKTVTLEGAKHQVIRITGQTKITKNNQPATLDDISAGTKVTGYKSETATDKWEAGSLKIIEEKTATEAPAQKK